MTSCSGRITASIALHAIYESLGRHLIAESLKQLIEKRKVLVAFTANLRENAIREVEFNDVLNRSGG
jgi:hypothetical protein